MFHSLAKFHANTKLCARNDVLKALPGSTWSKEKESLCSRHRYGPHNLVIWTSYLLRRHRMRPWVLSRAVTSWRSEIIFTKKRKFCCLRSATNYLDKQNLLTTSLHDLTTIAITLQVTSQYTYWLPDDSYDHPAVKISLTSTDNDTKSSYAPNPHRELTPPLWMIDFTSILPRSTNGSGNGLPLE